MLGTKRSLLAHNYLMTGVSGFAAGYPERYRSLEQDLYEEVLGILDLTEPVGSSGSWLSAACGVEVKGAGHHLNLAQAGELLDCALPHSS
jgi:hypothetical protein